MDIISLDSDSRRWKTNTANLVKNESRMDSDLYWNRGHIGQYRNNIIDSAVPCMCGDVVLCRIFGMCDLQYRHLRGQALADGSIDRFLRCGAAVCAGNDGNRRMVGLSCMGLGMGMGTADHRYAADDADFLIVADILQDFG